MKTNGSSKRRSRFARDKSSVFEPQKRDYDILRVLYSCRLLTTSQISDLFFPGVKRAQQRLRQLFDAKWVDRIARATLYGSKEFIHILGKQGVEVLANQMGIDKRVNPEEYKRINSVRLKAKRVGDLFLDHFIETNNFRIALSLAAQKSGYQVSFWRYEDRMRNQTDRVKDPANPTQLIPVVPDAFFGVRTPKGEAHFFLEVDMGTTKNPDFLRKMRGYVGYRLAHIHEKRHRKTYFRVLIVTSPDGKYKLHSRLKVLNELKQNSEIFYVAELTDTTPEKVFGEVWQVPKRGLRSLFEFQDSEIAEIAAVHVQHTTVSALE